MSVLTYTWCANVASMVERRVLKNAAVSNMPLAPTPAMSQGAHLYMSLTSKK
jgi:hypothetical protein